MSLYPIVPQLLGFVRRNSSVQNRTDKLLDTVQLKSVIAAAEMRPESPMSSCAMRFINLKPGERPPESDEWVLLRLISPGFYALTLAPALAARLSRNAVLNLGGIAAVTESENIARQAGLSVVYVIR